MPPDYDGHTQIVGVPVDDPLEDTPAVRQARQNLRRDAPPKVLMDGPAPDDPDAGRRGD